MNLRERPRPEFTSKGTLISGRGRIPGWINVSESRRGLNESRTSFESPVTLLLEESVVPAAFSG
ncbi:MAG: hypothetical protein ABI718_08355 [Acidobacteriota bacterium]